MKILVAGGGKVGSSLAQQLSVSGYDVTVIDQNQTVLDGLQERFDVMTVQGNCAAMDILLLADIKEVDLLIAVTGEDEKNLLSCMTAHGLNPKLHTIARIRNPEYSDQVYVMRDLFALSMTVNPEKQAAIEIEHLLKYPGFLKRDTFAKGRMELVELKIDVKSKLCNIALNDLNGIIKHKVLVCTVLRDGKAIAPNGNFVLKEGDHIFVTAPTRNLTHLLHSLGIITHKVKRVMICGGDRISYYLAKSLIRSGIDVSIIESDHNRCLHLAAILPDASIVHGDAGDQFLLDQEGIRNSDALITLTGVDELNIIISMYGNSCGVPQVITKLGQLSGNKIVDRLDIGSTICPKESCSEVIVRYVRAIYNQTGAALSVHSIAHGQAEAMEFLVDETTLHCDEPLKKLKTKKSVLIAGICRGIRTEVPDGESSFKPGDTVIVVSSGDDVIYSLNDIFE
ncbi:MAG: Trk system potassium transporter TrkA [Schaedlerella sp.]|nr:Trk system potassium transporter TrkA [Schaedlerella sp.]